VLCEHLARIVFTWQASGWPHPTEVDVTFAGDDGGTRVEVEHRAFERLGSEGDTVAMGLWDVPVEDPGALLVDERADLLALLADLTDAEVPCWFDLARDLTERWAHQGVRGIIV
jgi:hypothetical protein